MALALSTRTELPGMSASEVRVLSQLLLRPMGTTPQDLASRCGLAEKSIYVVLTRLRTKKYVKRKYKDRRFGANKPYSIYTITAAGLKARLRVAKELGFVLAEDTQVRETAPPTPTPEVPPPLPESQEQ